MLCQEIQNIMSLAIALKIKDLSSPNKIIWMVCPACSSMGYQLHSPAFVIDTAPLVPCISDYKNFLPSLVFSSCAHKFLASKYCRILQVSYEHSPSLPNLPRGLFPEYLPDSTRKVISQRFRLHFSVGYWLSNL